MAWPLLFDNETPKRPIFDIQPSGTNKGQKKERLFCSRCNFRGHTVDCCYKIHGHPPGYIWKQRSAVENVAINQVSDQDQSDHEMDQEYDQVGHFLKTQNSSRYKQLMTMLSTHLVSSVQASDSPEVPSTSYTTGSCFSISMNHVFDSMNDLIITLVLLDIFVLMPICLFPLNIYGTPQSHCQTMIEY